MKKEFNIFNVLENNFKVEEKLNKLLQLKRFEWKKDDYTEIDKFILSATGIKTNLVLTTEQYALDYTLISDITDSLPSNYEFENAYIEVFYVFDRKQTEIIITEIMLVME
jgi:hypothetical protein